MGTTRGSVVGNSRAPHDHVVSVWTTVERRWMTAVFVTCSNRDSSPIHNPYDYDYKYFEFLRWEV